MITVTPQTTNVQDAIIHTIILLQILMERETSHLYHPTTRIFHIPNVSETKL